MLWVGLVLAWTALSFFLGALIGVYLKTADEAEREDRARRYR